MEPTDPPGDNLIDGVNHRLDGLAYHVRSASRAGAQAAASSNRTINDDRLVTDRLRWAAVVRAPRLLSRFR